MRLWPYYTNVYYKYTHGSFNINNEIYYLEKIILHNISFVNIIIVGLKNQDWYPKLNVPWCTMLLGQLYYMYYNIKTKSAPKGITVVCFHPIVYINHKKLWKFSINFFKILP